MPINEPIRPKPPMPTGDDQVRAEWTASMAAVLHEDWEDLAERHAEKYLAEEVVETRGPPDTSDNVYADMCVELSSPGHYEREWSVSHRNRQAAKLIRPGGILDMSGYTARCQYAEYMAWGLSAVPVHIYATGPNALGVEVVLPSDVWCRWSVRDGSVPVELHHLRWRYIPTIDRCAWCWDVYEIPDPGISYTEDSPAPPARFRVLLGENVAKNPDLTRRDVPESLEKGEDLTEMLFGETYDGDDYRWFSVDGTAHIPYPILRTIDSGRGWDYTRRSAAYRGTLTLSRLASLVDSAAQEASSQTVAFTGVADPGTNVDGTGKKGSPRKLHRTPGAKLILSEAQDSKFGPKMFETSGGGQLQALSMYYQGRRSAIARRFGIAGADAVRNDANPTSASALLITESQKNAATRAIDSLVSRFDRQVMLIASIVLREHGTTVPESGYSFRYYVPPPTPAELKARREQEDYDIARGLTSRIELYMRDNPGASRDDAISKIRQHMRDEQILSMPIEMSPGPVTLSVDDYEDLVDEVAACGEMLEGCVSEERQPTPDEMSAVLESWTRMSEALGGDPDAG